MTRISSSRTRIAAALIAAAVGVATFAAGTGSMAAAAPPAGSSETQVLEERMRGEAAIRAMGDRLPEVAQSNGMTAAELARRLRADDQLWVGESGALLFVDEGLAHAAHDEAEHDEGASTSPSWTSHDPSEAFSLHSRPGASRVVHLDFDGHSTPGGGWSGTPGAPYDTEGGPGTFTDAERRVIIDVWRHVAEDFAPFAVDVTTADPGIDAIRRSSTSDSVYGTRVVITPTMTDCTSCGGVAYVGSYDAIGAAHDHRQPAWVYIAGTNAKHIAEAASHEAGHNLGLAHDGTASLGYYEGHGDWAPIMGVGYYEPITQWSRGEYAGANNAQDDFVVVGQNGGPLAGDDHGGSASTATPLDAVVDVLGEIGAGGDVDAFSLTTTGGLLSLQAAPVSVGPNLDLGLRLLDDAGALVTSVDGPGLDVGVETTLGAGTYTLVVDGVGAGDPATNGYSDYGSVGRYRLTGLLPSGEPAANRAPVASVTASTTSGTAPLPVRFDGSASTDPDGDALTHAWSFGDGQSATGAVVDHTFQAAGTYVVTLTVSDGELTSEATTTVTVRAASTKTNGKGGGGGGGGGGKPSKAR